MTHEIIPSSEFYEQLHVPSTEEMSEYEEIPLRAVEAHSILVNNSAKRNLSTVNKITLQRIADQDNGDETLDFKKVRSQVIKELNLDDD